MNKFCVIAFCVFSALIIGCGERTEIEEDAIMRRATNIATTNHEAYIIKTMVGEYEKMKNDKSEIAQKRCEQLRKAIVERMGNVGK